MKPLVLAAVRPSPASPTWRDGQVAALSRRRAGDQVGDAPRVLSQFQVV